MTLTLFQYLFVDPPEAPSEVGRAGSRERGMSREMDGVSAAVPVDEAELALVQRMAAGDEAALREVYDATYATLWDFARSVCGDRNRADELVQDAYIVLWRRARVWDVRSSVRGFLYLTVRHRARNDLRRSRVAERAVQYDADTIRLESMAASPRLSDVRAESHELIAAVSAAIRALPEPRQTAIVLRWREQMSYEDIAKVLGVAPATARQLVTRARQMLRGRIGHLFEK